MMRVEVGQFSDSVAANLARLRLEAEGIDSFLVDEHAVTNQPLNWIAVGGVKVFVAEAWAERARALLESAEAPAELPCSECSSSNVERDSTLRRLAFITTLAWLPVGRAKTSALCNDCGHAWYE